MTVHLELTDALADHVRSLADGHWREARAGSPEEELSARLLDLLSSTEPSAVETDGDGIRAAQNDEEGRTDAERVEEASHADENPHPGLEAESSAEVAVGDEMDPADTTEDTP